MVCQSAVEEGYLRQFAFDVLQLLSTDTKRDRSMDTARCAPYEKPYRLRPIYQR